MCVCVGRRTNLCLSSRHHRLAPGASADHCSSTDQESAAGSAVRGREREKCGRAGTAVLTTGARGRWTAAWRREEGEAGGSRSFDPRSDEFPKTNTNKCPLNSLQPLLFQGTGSTGVRTGTPFFSINFQSNGHDHPLPLLLRVRTSVYSHCFQNYFPFIRCVFPYR